MHFTFLQLKYVSIRFILKVCALLCVIRFDMRLFVGIINKNRYQTKMYT